MLVPGRARGQGATTLHYSPLPTTTAYCSLLFRILRTHYHHSTTLYHHVPGAAAAHADYRGAPAQRLHTGRHRYPQALRRAAALQAVGARHNHAAHAQAPAAGDRAVIGP